MTADILMGDSLLGSPMTHMFKSEVDANSQLHLRFNQNIKYFLKFKKGKNEIYLEIPNILLSFKTATLRNTVTLTVVNRSFSS